MDDIDNSKLKELMKDSSRGMSENNQKEFFKELSNASLYLPVDLDQEALNLNQDTLEKGLNGEIPITLSPFLLKQEDGKTILPLFTDKDESDKLEHHIFVSIGTLEIAKLLVDNKDIYGVIINPTDVDGVGISTDSFLGFVGSTKIKGFSDFVVKNSRPLKSESRFYLREVAPLMKQMSKDGIYTSELPFNVSFKDNFDENCKYLNILIFPRGMRFLYVGNIGEFSDSIFPPTLKFKLIEEDGNTFTWKCISQELGPVKKRNNIMFYLIAIVLIVVIIFILIQFFA